MITAKIEIGDKHIKVINPELLPRVGEYVSNENATQIFQVIVVAHTYMDDGDQLVILKTTEGSQT